MSRDRDVLAQAQLLVDSFIMAHHAPAIPALIGACVGWAVEHGGASLMMGSLKNAMALCRDLEKARRSETQ